VGVKRKRLPGGGNGASPGRWGRASCRPARRRRASLSQKRKRKQPWMIDGGESTAVPQAQQDSDIRDVTGAASYEHPRLGRQDSTRKYFLTMRSRRAIMCLEVGIMSERVMVIQSNSDGRPCGWGVAPTKAQAEAEARRQWDAHRCYPGESRGAVAVHSLKRCEANAGRGTGTGICDAPLDSLGLCPAASKHL